MDDNQCVANDCKMIEGESKFHIITGPNMVNIIFLILKKIFVYYFFFLNDLKGRKIDIY